MYASPVFWRRLMPTDAAATVWGFGVEGQTLASADSIVAVVIKGPTVTSWLLLGCSQFTVAAEFDTATVAAGAAVEKKGRGPQSAACGVMGRLKSATKPSDAEDPNAPL